MSAIDQLAQDNGLTILVRGTRYARLTLRDQNQTLTVFRGIGWEAALRAWIDGWAQGREQCKLRKIDGRVEVDGHDIQYSWVVPAIASAFRADMDCFAVEHISDELKRGATRGPLISAEQAGGRCSTIYGWWWSGDEEAVLREKEDSARKADMAATREYLDELDRVCEKINAVYDAAKAAGGKCYLLREGTSLGRINSRSTCRYHWIAVHLSEGTSKRTIRLAPKIVHGSGAGKYTISTSANCQLLLHGISPAHGHTEITVPYYPGIDGDKDDEFDL